LRLLYCSWVWWSPVFFFMKNDITSILDQLLQMVRDPDCNINTMWEFFKQTLSKSAKQHIPQKKLPVWLSFEYDIWDCYTVLEFDGHQFSSSFCISINSTQCW
jgi:hypothetical protein